jgi:hypothetical protein
MWQGRYQANEIKSDDPIINDIHYGEGEIERSVVWKLEILISSGSL